MYPLLVVYTSGFGPPLRLGAPSLGPVWVSLGLDTPGPDTPSLGTIGLGLASGTTFALKCLGVGSM